MRGRQNYPLKPQRNGNSGCRTLLLGEAMAAKGQAVWFFAYEPRRQQMATAITVTCQSAVCQLGSISFLNLLIVELVLADLQAPNSLVRGLLGSRIMKELVQICCWKYYVNTVCCNKLQLIFFREGTNLLPFPKGLPIILPTVQYQAILPARVPETSWN